MFTGIITSVGRISATTACAAGQRIIVESTWPDPDLVLGESIAIDGACMTVVAFEGSQFSVEVSSESLSLTTLGSRSPGDRVNLERALQVGERLGGHFVSGHVDGRGTLASRAPSGDCAEMTFDVPKDLMRYIVHKGSITIDGISLTVNNVDDSNSRLSVMIVPHTLAETSLGERALGDLVNLEVDVLGKYVERLLADRMA
ncbi:MAG: riboflavin synthase [Deltaproteobacteria bacterium]|nr:riboflavin synthase [Deltaproteobacteria bacterium]